MAFYITQLPYRLLEIDTRLTATFCFVFASCIKTPVYAEEVRGKISAQPHTTLCIQFLDRENNDKNNTLPLGKQICFTIGWDYGEILPSKEFLNTEADVKIAKE